MALVVVDELDVEVEVEVDVDVVEVLVEVESDSMATAFLHSSSRPVIQEVQVLMATQVG